MKRREFITLLGGAAAWPLAAAAQQPGKIVRVGFLGAQPNIPMIVAAFFRLLQRAAATRLRGGPKSDHRISLY